MKKIVLMSLMDARIEISPARYQILDELSIRGYETYLFLPLRLKHKKNFPSIDYVINTQFMSHKDVQRKIADIHPQAVIATTYEDALAIYKLPIIMKNTPFFYYNLEIYTPYLNRDIKRENFRYYMKYKIEYPVNKLREMVYTRFVKTFTIQDSLRRRLSRKYHIWHPNTILIPNSYVYDESLIIPEGLSGIVYTGGIKRDFLLNQFDDLKVVKNVPITFSGITDRWCRQKIKELKYTNPNIKFEEQVLSVAEYTTYIRQFAVGLVWYSPLKEDKAHYCMGLSSGKMFKHLSLGQPIIAVRCPGITEVVNRYRLGIVIDNISELEGAYETVMKNYSYYRENVLIAYRNIFDFKKVIFPFLECIDEFTK